MVLYTSQGGHTRGQVGALVVYFQLKQTLINKI